MGTRKPTTETRSRLIARVLRDVLASQDFESLADVLDVLKFRLARLRIPWTNDECNDALSWIASNRELWTPRRRQSRPVVARSPEFNRHDARAWCEQRGIAIRTMGGGV